MLVEVHSKVKRVTTYVPLGLIAWSITGSLCLAAPPTEPNDASADDTELAALEQQKGALLRTLALMHEALHEWDKAARCLSQLTVLEPFDKEHTRKLFIFLRYGDRWQEMIQIYTRLLETDPNGGHHYLLDLAECYLRIGEKERALELYRQRRKKYGDNEWACSQMAFSLRENGCLDEAETILEEGLAGPFKNSSRLLTSLGAVHAKRDEPEKAIGAYEAALELARSAGTRRSHILNELMPLYEKTGTLNTVAERVLTALEADAPDPKYDRDVEYMIRALAKSGDDRYSKLLMPLLDHPEPRIATLVVKAMGQGSDHHYFPPLLLKALKSKRPEVVAQAIKCAPDCYDEKREPELQKLLRKIFEGENEPLKFEACFALMHEFNDQEAIAYILDQTQSEDPERARRAIAWLGDSCNARRRPVYPELLKKVVPYLSSEDPWLRREAVDTLAIYQGEVVVRYLIAALGDTDKAVRSDARIGLVSDQRDREMVRRLLHKALVTTEERVVRNRIVEVLRAIEKREAQEKKMAAEREHG